MKSTNYKFIAQALLASILIMTASSQAATIVLLSDDFNTANNTDLNQNLATRQAGTLESAGSNWTETSGSTNAILSNQLNVTNGASTSHVVNNADFEADLTSANLSTVSGFSLAFDFDYTGTAGAWSSAYLSTHNFADERGNSRFGFIAFGTGDLQFYGDSGFSINNATMATLVSGWNVTNLNSFSFVATRSTATTGIYDVFVNGIEVASNRAYTFGTGGTNGEVNFEVINIGNGAGLYDNFSITTVPEPSAALLGSLGLLALMRRRR